MSTVATLLFRAPLTENVSAHCYREEREQRPRQRDDPSGGRRKTGDRLLRPDAGLMSQDIKILPRKHGDEYGGGTDESDHGRFELSIHLKGSSQ